MKQKQLMQKNLAKLLKEIDYKSCGSDVEDDIQCNPVNPFMKKVFEKRMRSSSVASQNMNPNTSISHTENYSRVVGCNQRMQSVIQRLRGLLDKLDESLVIQANTSKKTHYKSSKQQTKRFQNIEQTILTICSQLQKQLPNLSEHLISNTSSINHLDYYQCQSSNYRTTGSTNQQNNKISSKRIPNNNNKGKNLTNSLVTYSNTNYNCNNNYNSNSNSNSHFNSNSNLYQNQNHNPNHNHNQSKQNHGKSVYQAVLQQRKNRKHKHARIV